ncbi:MAG: HAD family hydrolase [Acidobacteria bacterium]|nr:HAD family hydrolase [Acidobacteriota bacterium]
MPHDATRAVFFDVDFTLIYPGPTFQGSGYRRFCARHGIEIDPSKFEQAVARASALLDREQQGIYDPQIFVDYTRRIIEEMGGRGGALDTCAREIYEEWAVCHHFSLYDDVAETLRDLAERRIRIGLISNTHRCLASFQTHFELQGLISVAVSSSEHGYMKPHPSIFEAALRLMDVPPREALMVGDSLKQDIEGAARLGMRGVLVCRSGHVPREAGETPVIQSLSELPAHL